MPGDAPCRFGGEGVGPELEARVDLGPGVDELEVEQVACGAAEAGPVDLGAHCVAEVGQLSGRAAPVAEGEGVSAVRGVRPRTERPRGTVRCRYRARSSARTVWDQVANGTSGTAVLKRGSSLTASPTPTACPAGAATVRWP